MQDAEDLARANRTQGHPDRNIGGGLTDRCTMLLSSGSIWYVTFLASLTKTRFWNGHHSHSASSDLDLPPGIKSMMQSWGSRLILSHYGRRKGRSSPNVIV